MRKHRQSEMIVTDRLLSYWAGLKDPGVTDSQSTGGTIALRIRTRRIGDEKARCCRSGACEICENFAAVHAAVSNHFNQERSFCSREKFKLDHLAVLSGWRDFFAA